MSTRQLREYIISHRRNTRETTYYTKKCLQNIGGRLQPGIRVGFVPMPGAASTAASGRQRGAGGDQPPFPDFEPISDQQLKRFKVDYLLDGTPVVLKQRGTPPAATWHYIVPADDLHPFLLSLALAGLGINRAFAKAFQQYKVRLSNNPDGTPRWTGEGAYGLGKDGVRVWSEQDIVAADRRPLPPAAEPPTQPIPVNRVNEHWQTDLFDNADGTDPNQRYVMNLVDLATKFVLELYALRTKSAKEVLLVLYHTCLREGFPAILQTDNGSEFCAREIEQFCALFGIEFRHGSVGHPNVQGQVENKNRGAQDAMRSLLLRYPSTTWGFVLPWAKYHMNTSPTAALGGRCPYWARYGVNPNVSQMPPLGDVLKLMGFSSSRDAAVLTFELEGVLLPQAGAAQKKRAKKRPAPEAGSEDEDEETEAAGAAMLLQLGVSSGPRPRRQGAGANMGALIAELEMGLGGAEEAGPSRALPGRAAAVSSPAGSRRQLQLDVRPFEDWAEQEETAGRAAAASIPEDEEAAEPEWRPGHSAELRELLVKNRQYIKKKGRGQPKPGAEPKDWKIGDIVCFAPRRCGVTGKPRGVRPQKEVFKVVGRKGRGALKFFKLRSNSGVLQAEVRGEELERAVPERAAQLEFEGVATEGVGTVSMTALARGEAKGCGCRKQCGPKCPCKKRKSPCHRGCGCKCKTGANCGNH